MKSMVYEHALIDDWKGGVLELMTAKTQVDGMVVEIGNKYQG